MDSGKSSSSTPADQPQSSRRRVRFREPSPSTASSSSSDSGSLSKRKASLSINGNAHRQKGDGLDRRDLGRLGVPPIDIIGKVLVSIQRAHIHPKLILRFDDGSVYEVRVDICNPGFLGVTKEIMVDHDLEDIISRTNEDGLLTKSYTISHATVITMQDHAFQVKGSGERVEWVKRHAAVAVRFKEENHTWHSISVMLANYDSHGKCTLRSFDDVYLHRAERPTTRKLARGRKITHRYKEPQGSSVEKSSRRS
ncbi:hypothetical protein BDY19DRAFT_882360 [Irpex rosettiformis]|uniref:Uncharacterized protein n=1 Tax=Irpex rosettiformis TaxID=378272 RepID=A0ACB8UF84_9APHY|nr:hypothetical protein BDY19DRAFT_882360 [Irpex rosettiformis]